MDQSKPYTCQIFFRKKPSSHLLEISRLESYMFLTWMVQREHRKCGMHYKVLSTAVSSGPWIESQVQSAPALRDHPFNHKSGLSRKVVSHFRQNNIERIRLWGLRQNNIEKIRLLRFHKSGLSREGGPIQGVLQGRIDCTCSTQWVMYLHV